MPFGISVFALRAGTSLIVSGAGEVTPLPLGASSTTAEDGLIVVIEWCALVTRIGGYVQRCNIINSDKYVGWLRDRERGGVK